MRTYQTYQPKQKTQGGKTPSWQGVSFSKKEI